MTHIKIAYAIILLSIIILLTYINKLSYLEGYTFMPVLNVSDPNTPFLQKINDVQQTTCEAQCNKLPNCTGFISNIPYNVDLRGNCTFYNGISRNINNMKYDVNNNLYIK
jgi:hypothetical protein